jgi:hypothetical protein
METVQVFIKTEVNDGENGNATHIFLPERYRNLIF